LVARLSNAYLRSNQQDQARTVLLDWLSKHGDDLLITEQVAEMDIAQNKLDDAQKYLELLLKQKPHNAVALNNMAWVLQQKGQNDEALKMARQAYILAPNQQTADTLGWILASTGKSQEAVPLLRQAAGDAATADPRILYHYAVALKDTGNTDEAKKSLQVVVGNKGTFKEKEEAQKLLDDMSKGG
jgi:predicted Zn-dependent protease